MTRPKPWCEGTYKWRVALPTEAAKALGRSKSRWETCLFGVDENRYFINPKIGGVVEISFDAVIGLEYRENIRGQMRIQTSDGTVYTVREFTNSNLRDITGLTRQFIRNRTEGTTDDT